MQDWLIYESPERSCGTIIQVQWISRDSRNRELHGIRSSLLLFRLSGCMHIKVFIPPEEFPNIFMFMHSKRVCYLYEIVHLILTSLIFGISGLRTSNTFGLSKYRKIFGLSNLRNTGRTPYRRVCWSQWKVSSLILCYEFYVGILWILRRPVVLLCWQFHFKISMILACTFNY